MFTMLVSDQATIWPNLGDEGITASGRYGHTATYIPDKSSVYVFGGFSAGTNVIMNDMFALDLRTRSWTKIVPSGGVAPEYRAFHTATLISKNTKILYAFGQNGNNQDVLSNTYSIYDITTNTWSKAVAPVVVLEITHSPFIDTTPPPVPATNNTVPSSNPTNPNDGTNNSDNPTNKASPGINIAMIGGICGGVVLLILLIILAIILIRRRNRRPVRNFTPAPLPPKDMKILYKNGGDDDEEDEKKAKAFMIRRPPSVYMDEQDGDGDIPHPHYKSQYYGSSNGRNSPSIAEYELTTSGGGSGGAANTLSMVSSVAERRRYVEAQQQQFIDDYENTYKHPPPFEPNSKEERNWDSEDDEPLPRKTNQTNSRAGPRYPQAQNGRNPSSNYDLDDYI
ncbi:Multiple epidermal growth factor-like domains protein 8 [Entomortierella beljakovae]|nr:Multiple epidermal growth factor-like domains protein 8 [Entomortierella beljakovae]